MARKAHVLAWLPPFLVGGVAAASTEVAVGMLLYAGPGLVRSLTVVLAVSVLSLGAGLWSSPSPGSGAVDRLRRRWLFCLFVFLGAAVFGLAWSVPEVVANDRIGQVIGLTVLAALPLFSTGNVLGGIVALTATGPGGVRSGAAAVVGAAAGFVATGALLPRTPLPASLLLACLAALSLAGLVFGIVTASVPDVSVRAEVDTPAGPVRVEDRRIPIRGSSMRVLLEGPHERRRESLEEGGEAPWDVAMARLLMPDQETEWRLLVVGGGASTLARAAVREHPRTTVDVLERRGEVVALAREHLGTGLEVGASASVRVGVGNIEDLVKGVRDRYDVVFVDARSLAPLGGGEALSREARGRLVQAVGASGVLVWGPSAPERTPELAERWASETFGRIREDGAEEVVVLLSVAERGEPSPSPDGFVRRNGRPSAP